MTTRSMTRNFKPKTFSDFIVYSTRHHLQVPSMVITETEPSTYTQAVSSPEWCAAMGHEFDALMINETWFLCPRPSGKHVV